MSASANQNKPTMQTNPMTQAEIQGKLRSNGDGKSIDLYIEKQQGNDFKKSHLRR
jgi:hypothetical protein